MQKGGTRGSEISMSKLKSYSPLAVRFYPKGQGEPMKIESQMEIETKYCWMFTENAEFEWWETAPSMTTWHQPYRFAPLVLIIKHD